MKMPEVGFPVGVFLSLLCYSVLKLFTGLETAAFMD